MLRHPDPVLPPRKHLAVRGIVDAAAMQLRDAVLSGELEPGTALTEALVSSRLGIARPSAKAAIEKLTGEGILERTAYRSARVVTLDVASIRDIYQTRRRLESAALIELAATRHAPDAAAAANEEIKRLRNEHPRGIVEHDMAFHLAIIDALASPRTSALYRRIVTEVRLCMAQVQSRRLLDTNLIGDEHSRILNALQEGDGDGAVALLTTHLAQAESRLAAASSSKRAG